MTIGTISQVPFVCNTLAELATLLTLYPSIPEMTQCYIKDLNDIYQLQSGVWVQTFPDPELVMWLQNNTADIGTLQTQMAGKASASALSTLNSTVSSLSTAVSNKADSSTVTSLSGTVSTLATTVAGKFNTPTGTTGQYVRGDGTLSTFPSIPSSNIAWVPATASRSIVTGTGATGFRPSTTTNTLGIYNLNLSTTASIAGGADGYVVGEICPTNSATASDWITISKTRNAQSYSLAVAVQGVQNICTPLTLPIPAGWYAKLRTVTTLGTYAPTYDSGSETPMS